MSQSMIGSTQYQQSFAKISKQNMQKIQPRNRFQSQTAQGSPAQNIFNENMKNNKTKGHLQLYQSEFHRNLQNIIRDKVVKQILLSFEKEEVKKALKQKLINRQQIKEPNLPILTEMQQIQADNLQKRKTEDFIQDFIQKRIIHSKQIQKLMDFTTDQAEQLIFEEINQEDYMRVKKDQKSRRFIRTSYNSPRKSKAGILQEPSINHKLESSPNQSRKIESPMKMNEEVALFFKQGTMKTQSINGFVRRDTINLGRDKNQNQLSIDLQNSSVQQQAGKNNSTANMTKENFIKINQIIDNLDEPQEEIDKQNYEYFQFIQGQEETKSIVKNYGRKMKVLLEKWCDNEEYRQAVADPKLDKYTYDTWGDLIDFEKKLKEEMQKFYTFQERIKYSTYSNLDWIKTKTSDYIQSLENALNESKLQTFQTIERLQMSLEDHESRAFNVLNDNDFMKSAIEVQKEIADQKDITNFRGAMQQVTRLKQVLEKLHKDYIKMVSQGKQMHDDLQLFKDQNENLNKELDNQKITNENLIDIIKTILKTAILYKDEQILNTGRKTVNEIDLKQKDKVPSQLSRLISFMRMYQPVDLVTPLRKECETYKILLYVLIDYLQNTGQLNKFWIPILEDTDEQHKSIIDGWQKNYLVTVMENESLQFLMRFRQQNLEMPIKYQVPAHIIEREKQQKIKLEKMKEEAMNNAQETFNLSDTKNQDLKTNTFLTDKQGAPLIEDKSSIGKGDPKNQSQTKNQASRLAIKQDPKSQSQNPKDQKQNQQKSSKLINQNPNQSIQKVQPQNVNNGNLISSKGSTQDLIPPKRNLQRGDSKRIIDIGQNAQSPNLDGKKLQKINSSFHIQGLVKNVKLPQDIISTLCEVIDAKFDKSVVENLVTKYKSKKADLDKNEKHTKVKDDSMLSEQESKVYFQILTNQTKQSSFMDASNLIKSFNEVLQEYFSETQTQKWSTDQEKKYSQYLSLIEFKGKVYILKHDKAIEYLASNKSTPSSLQELFYLVVRLNKFISNDISYTNDLQDVRDIISQQVTEQLNVPSQKQNKVLSKLYKLRENLKQIYEKDNTIGEDYIKVNPNNFKVNDVWTMIQSPFFRYSINEIGILKVLSILETNLQKLNMEDNFYVVSDLIRYKLTDPNIVFEDYLKKKLSKIPKQMAALSPRSLLSEGIQAFASQHGDSQQDILFALKNINQQIQTQMGRPLNVMSEDQLHTDFVNILSHRSSITNIMEHNQNTQSAFSVSELSNNLPLNAQHSPLNVLSHKQFPSSTNQTEIDKKRKSKKKVEMIRQETIKTIKVLQSFVKQSVGNSHQAKQNSFIQLATLQSFSDNLQQFEGQKQSQSPRKASKLKISKANNAGGKGGVEQQKSITKAQAQIALNSNNLLNLTPKNRMLNVQQTQKTKSICQSPKKSAEKHQTPINEKNRSRISSYHDQEENSSNQNIEDYGFENFQNQKEKELFGGLKLQMKEIANNVYLRKMKQFDTEIEKLKKANKNKRSFINQAQSQNATKKTRKGISSTKLSPTNKLFDFNVIELQQRMNHIEKNQDFLMNARPNINIVNSNINIDNSYIPEFFMKKLESQNPNQQFSQYFQREPQTSKHIISNSKMLDKHLEQARHRVIGSSQHLKFQKFNNLYGNFSSQHVGSPSSFNHSQNFSFDAQIQQQQLQQQLIQQQDQFEQTARFTLRNQNTLLGNQSTHGSVVGGGAGGTTTQNESLRPKYFKREVLIDQNNRITELPSVIEKQ